MRIPRRARIALLGAALGVGLLALVRYAAFHVGWLERADQSALHGFYDLQHRPHVTTAASLIAGLCDPKPYAGLALLPVLVALLRRRWWLAVGIGALLLGANVTSELLKPLLATPRTTVLFDQRSPISPSSWPSGHATAAMALALAWVLAVPGRWRGVAAAAGSVFAVAVCYAFLTLEWHYPSDVLGGFLVAAVWTLIAVAGVLIVEHDEGRSSRALASRNVSLGATLAPAGTALGLATVLAGLVAVTRPHEVVQYASQHGAFVAVALIIMMMGLAVATGISLMTRR